MLGGGSRCHQEVSLPSDPHVCETARGELRVEKPGGGGAGSSPEGVPRDAVFGLGSWGVGWE